MPENVDDQQAERAPASDGQHRRREEQLIAGRLAILLLRNQLDSQVAALRTQLALTEANQREAQLMLEKIDDRLARQHPATFAALTGEGGADGPAVTSTQDAREASSR
jgi:hypothetical protein